MVKKLSAKVVSKTNTSVNDATRFTIKCGEKMFIFSITERYVLIHNGTTIEDVTFSDSLEAKIRSLNDDGSVYQVDLK